MMRQTLREQVLNLQIQQLVSQQPNLSESRARRIILAGHRARTSVKYRPSKQNASHAN